MKKSIKFLIIFIVLIISLISIYLITSNQKEENKVDESSTYENSSSKNNDKERDDNMTTKINININGTNYTATLEDNPTTREFIKRLPLELNMTELNGNEKYYYFDSSLPSNSSRIGKINNGDIMLYGSDCLVLFYETFNTSYSYTRIGKIDNPSSLKENVGKGSIRISFSK